MTKLFLMALGIHLIAQSAMAAGNTGGGCYNLQIIAVNPKTADMTNTSGHSLFVPIDGRARISLTEGAFSVIDRNGTDRDGASFSLPKPNLVNPQYRVMARLVGKPGSGMDMTTCGTDAAGVTYCSENVLSMSRIKGPSSFRDVSAELLSLTADINGDGIVETIGLFDGALQEYYWQLDTQGRLHAQLRFCPM